MNPMKFKKISDEDNILGFDEIIIFDKQLDTVLHYQDMPDRYADRCVPGEVYWYSYICIADGTLTTISEEDWEALECCYEYVKE